MSNQDLWQQVETDWNELKEPFKNAYKTASEKIPHLCELYGTLLDRNDQECIGLMRRLLQREVVSKKDIAIFISRFAPELEIEGLSLRNVERYAHPQYKHTEKTALSNTKSLLSDDDIMSSLATLAYRDIRAIMKTLPSEEVEVWNQAVRDEYRERTGKDVSPEPSLSDLTDMLKKVSDLPEDCNFANALFEYSEIVSATHPEHGHAWCLQWANFIISIHDHRFKIDEQTKQEIITILVTGQDHIRHVTKTLHHISAKWGTLIRDKVITAMREQGKRIPEQIRNSKQRERVIKEVHEYLNAKAEPDCHRTDKFIHTKQSPTADNPKIKT